MIIDLTKDDPKEKKKYKYYLKIYKLKRKGKTTKEIAKTLKLPVAYIEKLESCTMFI